MSAPAPWKHQLQTLELFKSCPRGNDFSDPGTGKTRGQIDNYAQRKNAGRYLIVCPKTLMYSAWGCDIETFAPGMTYALAYAENREEAFKLNTDAVIINTDGVKWIAEHPNVLKGFDHVSIDESTAFKHNTSQRSKALLKIRKAFKYRYAMTGTPNPISVTELHTPMLFVDDGKRLGESFYRFRSVMQTPHQIGPSANHLEWRDKPGAAQAVDELIADITVRHDFETVMSHVPKNRPPEVKAFQLSKRAAALYTKMENECVVAIKQSVVSAVHAASLRTKLLQMASGAVYSGGDDAAYEVVDRARYELIAELVEERAHSVVFFNWRHQRDELAKEFTKAKLSFAVIDGTVNDRERDQIVKAFQAGQYRTLLLHPKTGAHGLTLTRATTTIIASPFYEADLFKQAIHRIYRGGQTEVTNTLLVEAANTVERIVYEKLFDKQARMTDLLDLIQSRRAA